MRIIHLLFLIITLIIPIISFAQTDTHLYSTWDVIEVDTCASAWLIKRYVDKDAQFKFFPKGEFISDGIPFDTPDAELRRRHGVSTFESIIAKYDIKDPKILKMGKILHEIEINYWEGSSNKEVKALDNGLKQIIDSSKSPDECLSRSFMFLDEYYKKM